MERMDDWQQSPESHAQTSWGHGEMVATTCASEPVSLATPRIAPDDRPTILIAGLPSRAGPLGDWAERAGLRCIGRIGLDEVAARLGCTIAVDLILVDMRDGGEIRLDRTAALALTARHGLGEARLAVLADLDSLDCAMAWLDSPGTDFLCAPMPSDIISLLALTALSAEAARGGPHLHDVTRESEAGRLEQLSDEVRRLAVTIEQLTERGTMARAESGVMAPRSSYRTNNDAQSLERPFQPPAPHPQRVQAVLPHHGEIRALLRARRLRDQFLPGELFADPAWDMILDLLAARLAGQRVSVSSLCIAAAVPPTTALRWIRQLTERGVFARIDDPADGRRVFIELTRAAADAALDWAAAVRRNGGLLVGD